MNGSALRHPKLLDFAEALERHCAERQRPLPPGLARPAALGLLELLWDFTAEYAPAGDVGRYSNAHIARALDWQGDAEWLIGVLVELQWLDLDDDHRIVVHDWTEHCPRACGQRLADAGRAFADGAAPLRQPRRGTAGYRAKHPDGPPPRPRKRGAPRAAAVENPPPYSMFYSSAGPASIQQSDLDALYAQVRQRRAELLAQRGQASPRAAAPEEPTPAAGAT